MKFILLLSGLTSGVILALILIFLFAEAGDLVGQDPVSEESGLYIHQDNSVDIISAALSKKIFDGETLSWKNISGLDEDISLFFFDDITEYVDEDEIGDDFENVPEIISRIIAENKNIIAFLPNEYVVLDSHIKKLEVEEISLWGMLTGKEWYPTSEPSPLFGLIPLFAGTLMVTFFSIIFAIPFAIGTSIYLAELANKKERRYIKFFIELLNSIPSVVFGFFGLTVVVPWVQKTFNVPLGETALAGSIVLAIMILPTIITLSEDALKSTPKVLKEASYALGSNRWQMIYKVMIPFALPGINTAFVLGLGRAFGETMAVLMVTGNASGIPGSILDSVRTIPATIAAELGEAPVDGLHYKSLFLLGVILFLFTFTINVFITFRKKNALK